ncbi:hypothetical protein BV898_12829 [Hypsibius exemplaris]|uniref:Receptor ligand binding region domain-containing protein n=1 Tax=Hypsibius exemplaris TaxID=2072580 RepID=A0A1W0WCK4_HYPEX|nr:hypothetical protein BV898_12829 [Hypsibius exemplaris]
MAVKQIEIVTSLAYNTTLIADVVFTGAAFDLAVRRVNRNYAGFLNVSVTFLYNASLQNCPDVSAQNAAMLAEYYFRRTNRETCYALVTSPCTDEAGIWSLANGKFDPTTEFSDPEGEASTAVAVGGTLIGYGRIVLDILTYFAWYHVSILVDTNALSVFYRNLANLLLDQRELLASARPRANNQTFNFLLYSLDMTSNSSINTVVTLAKQKSRGSELKPSLVNL